MRFQNRKNHVIDLLFPIALFFVFAMSALVVILLAANIYQKTTSTASTNYTSRTVLSYVSEKIRQNNEAGDVMLGDFNGQEALIISQTIKGKHYQTFIYEYNHSLMELFVADDVDSAPSDGTSIMDVKEFKLESIGNALYRFTCIDTNGVKASIVASAIPDAQN